MTTTSQIEQDFITKLGRLKYTYRPDIRDRAALEVNFREKFKQLNKIKLTDDEFARFLEEIVTPDVSSRPRKRCERCALSAKMAPR